MRILMMIHGLPMGGAQTFFVRLALGLARQNGVHVYFPGTQDSDASLLKTLADARIPVWVAWWSRARVYRWVYKASLLIQRQWPAFCLVDWLRTRFLRRLQRTYCYDVINAHLCEAERLACLAFADHKVRIVGNDHGDYRSWMTSDAPAFQCIFKRSDALVCPSADSLKIVERFPWSARCRRVLVYHGFEADSVPTTAQTNAKPRQFTFGMVSRGVREKGWAEALAAFAEARRRSRVPLRLVLVGEGPHLDQLRADLAPALAPHVTFAGYQADPAPFVARFDVGLLPTYFAGESLPNVVIEYLAQGKPVIATAVGGIPEMLRVGEEWAGVLVGKNEGRACVAELADAMVRLAEDAQFRERRAKLALQARERFRMERCLEQYMAVFRGEESSSLEIHKGDQPIDHAVPAKT